MPTTPDAPRVFEPPGPGSWGLDTAHFPQPVTRFVTELFGEPAHRGFREATARYGLLLDHIEWAFVHRWAYLCPRPVDALEAAGDGLTQQSWEALVESSPALRERLATSERVFVEQAWREDVRTWDEMTKPAMRRDHLALQSVAARPRDGHGLRDYLDRCRDNLRRAIYHHHHLNVAPVIPAGDFLVHAAQWTGRPATELVQLIRGDDPPGAAPELSELAAAMRDDPAGTAVLDADDRPEAILAALAGQPAPVGPAATEYLGRVSHWSVGSGNDVSDPCLGELPGVLLGTIRGARDDAAGPSLAQAQAERIATIRRSVPQHARATFDALLAEAQASHRVRDERATYCDVWAYGLARGAILEAGAHLADTGVIDRPELLVEAGYDEMRSLLETGAGPSAEELAARARYRTEATEATVPDVLGGPPRAPVPAGWLPAGAARTERAFRAYVGAMSGDTQPPADEGGTGLRGLAASPGTYAGPARVVRAAAELGRIQQGDILVTGTMTPAFNAVLPLVGAVVTDRGGLLSHAAIVAREYGIPAVVGATDATSRIPDGAALTVDGTAGTVQIRD